MSSWQLTATSATGVETQDNYRNLVVDPLSKEHTLMLLRAQVTKTMKHN